ncbi:MAG TPA: hypothetical protein VII06_07205 [Chloroflexota bacterium]|jgi:hypothetical protein
MAAPVDAAPKPLAPPRAAAVAGVVFSVLLIISLALIRWSVPTDPTETAAWLADSGSRHTLGFALNLVPFAGIAFLWFMGVLRTRLGEREDQFFAMVFLGSGLLFLAMLFAAAALAGGLLFAVNAGTIHPLESEIFSSGRLTIYVLLNVFAVRMAGVFMFDTCTMALRTGILPRWTVFLGYLSAVVLLLVITDWPWIALLFPLWILLASACILLEEFRGQHPNAVRGRVRRRVARRELPAAWRHERGQ